MLMMVMMMMMMVMMVMMHRATEYELRQMKLSVDDQLRRQDGSVRQLQKKVIIIPFCSQSCNIS